VHFQPAQMGAISTGLDKSREDEAEQLADAF
jgi:hypothetical protein